MWSSYDVLHGASSALVAAPEDEPVSLAEAKAHLRRADTQEDSLIQNLIVAAREKVEQDTGRALVSQTWDVWIEAFPDGPLLLPKGRLQSVTSVKSYDTSDVETTVNAATYVVDTASEPGRLVLTSGSTWPSNTRTHQAGVVRAVFGYGDVDAVPQALKQAMLLLVGALHEHREQVIVAQFAGQFLLVPFGYDQLITPYRLWLG